MCKIICTYKFFMDDRAWRTHTGERVPLWCTGIIFTCTDGKCSIPPFQVHHINHYIQYINCNIPSDWVVRNSPSGYIYHDGWLKSMSHFSSMCFSYPLDTQVLLYYFYASHFDDRMLNILWSHCIQSLILNSGNYVHNQKNYNGTNLKLDYFMVMQE